MSEKITFETEDGDIELYVLEQTTLFGCLREACIPDRY